ncbi:MAG: DUF308 domain-containing protein [Oscillospiraceae bacterium]
MADFFKDLKKSFALSAIFSVVMGLLLMFYADMAGTAICLCLAAILTVRGVSSVVRYFFNKEEASLFRFDLIWGLILVAMGIFVFLRADVVISIVPLLFGLFILVNGVMTLQKAFNLKQLNYEKWWISALLGLLKGVLGGVMVMNPFAAAVTMVRFIGACLIFDGLSSFWTIFALSLAKKQTEQIIKSVDEIAQGEIFKEETYGETPQAVDVEIVEKDK